MHKTDGSPGPRDVVGVSLMASAETEAIVAWLKDHVPDASITFRTCFYKIERAGALEFDLAAIGEYLGRPMDVEAFQINLSSFYGRVVVDGGRVRIQADIDC